MNTDRNELVFRASNYARVEPIVKTWHYSKGMPKGSHICFEWADKEDTYAVAVYGNGVNPYQAAYLSDITKCVVTNANFVELTRLARVDPRRDDAPLTRFLSMCHQQLRAAGIEWVVSFSDPEQAHTGGIYRAANFFPAGKTQAEWHLIDENGNKHHRRVAYRHAKRNGTSIAEARETLGLHRVKTLPKQRWLLPLVPAHRRRLLKIAEDLFNSNVG